MGGEVVAFVSAQDRLKLVRCENGHEYQDLDAALNICGGWGALCRECGSRRLDCVYNNDGSRALAAGEGSETPQ